MTLLEEPQSETAVVVTTRAATTWQPVCRLDDLQPNRGVAALVGDRAVAIFRLDVVDLHARDHGVRAVDNVDPYADASVLSRGLVGCTVRDGRAVHYVASPLRKQRFDLVTGEDLDGDARLDTWSVRVTDGTVEVGSEASCRSNEPETSA